MKSTTILAGFAALAVAQNQSAPIIQANPHGVAYQASLQTSKPIQGSIIGQSAENGTGVQFRVAVSGLASVSGGPFLYHIHVNPVPSDGNCTGTGGHLDPYMRMDSPPCNATAPQTCQVGDLSGKHGTINTTANTYNTSYLDLYLSTVPGNTAFFGNRSWVIHASNGTRLNCGNFSMVTTGSTGNATSSTKPPSATFTGDAVSQRLNSFGTIASGLIGLGFAMAAFAF